MPGLLTRAQAEVCEMFDRGLRIREIAEMTDRGEQTVKELRRRAKARTIQFGGSWKSRPSREWRRRPAA